MTGGDVSDGSVADAARGVGDGARAAWLRLADMPLADGWSRRLSQNGFVEHDLRHYRGEDWMFSAILNDEWVLWYARKPAFRAGIVDRDAMLAAFPDARVNKKGEALSRLHDADAAQALIDWMRDHN